VTKIGYAQYDVEFGEYDKNTDTVRRMVGEAADAELLVLPELGLSGYEFKSAAEVERYAEPFGAGPTGELLKELSAKHKTTLVIGYPEYTTKGCHNSAMIATPGGDLFNYRKLHLFSRETELFIPGDAEPPVVDTPAGRVGLMICFDWIFPETARMLALRGAQVITHPSNLVLQWCQRAMFTRCLENAVFAITANRVGTEDRAGRTLTYTGASQVLDPKGETLISAPTEGEHLGLVDVDLAQADDKHITEYNDLLADRRPDHYGAIADTPATTDA